MSATRMPYSTIPCAATREISVAPTSLRCNTCHTVLNLSIGHPPCDDSSRPRWPEPRRLEPPCGLVLVALGTAPGPSERGPDARLETGRKAASLGPRRDA